MSGFHRILVPTDFSVLSTRPAEVARTLAEKFAAELHVVHVVAPPTVTESVALAPGVDPQPSQPAMDALLEGARVGLANYVREHFAGAPVKCALLAGVAYSQLCEYAQEHGCDLIVMGSHAHGMVHRIFLGSVSKAVLEHSPCPVLIVPLKSAEGAAG